MHVGVVSKSAMAVSVSLKGEHYLSFGKKTSILL